MTKLSGTAPEIVEDDDAHLVVAVAEDYVRRLGRDTVPYLRAQQKTAERHDDDLAVKAWHDIADAAEKLLSRVD